MKYTKRLIGLLAFTYLILNAPSMHYKAIRNYVGSKVVTLTFTDTKKFGGGTGVHVHLRHGGDAILTNAHVCALKDEHNEILVHSPYLEKPIPRRVIEVANFTDLCLIEGLPGVTGLSLGETPEAGDIVGVVGHPLLMPTTMTRGEVIGEGEVTILDYIIYNDEEAAKCSLPKNKILTIDTFFGMMTVCAIRINALHTTAVIFPGNSGSPVTDYRGRLIALAFASDNETHWGLAVTLDDIQHFLYPY